MAEQSFEVKITSMTSSSDGVEVNVTGSFTGFGWGITEAGIRNKGERRGAMSAMA